MNGKGVCLSMYVCVYWCVCVLCVCVFGVYAFCVYMYGVCVACMYGCVRPGKSEVAFECLGTRIAGISSCEPFCVGAGIHTPDLW